VQRLREDPERLLNGHGAALGDLMTAEELHAIYDPAGEKRASANAMARELKRAGFAYPATGMPLKTKEGIRRAYAIKNIEHWNAAKWSEAVAHYEEHHALVKPAKAKKY
jgi:hypothetical protein